MPISAARCHTPCLGRRSPGSPDPPVGRELAGGQGGVLQPRSRWSSTGRSPEPWVFSEGSTVRPWPSGTAGEVRGPRVKGPAVSTGQKLLRGTRADNAARATPCWDVAGLALGSEPTREFPATLLDLFGSQFLVRQHNGENPSGSRQRAVRVQGKRPTEDQHILTGDCHIVLYTNMQV